MQNYHKHTYYSNIMIPDSTCSYEKYAQRAKELGHKVLCSLEHGWQGHYYNAYDIVKKNNDELKEKLKNNEITQQEYNKQSLKFIFGAEAYWVKNRFEKDRSNCHIVLLAKNEEGRRDINDVLSQANIDGYYGQPRLDLELLMKIKPENVMVTTACVKFWVYDDIEDILVKLHNHFKNNLYLEVQYHNTERQKELNRKIIKLSYKYSIDIILGYDSHYIYEDDEKERLDYLEGRDIVYNDDETGWYMDYPTDEEAYNRLKIQGILSDKEIKQAMDNTDKILDFDDIEFNKDIKLPTLYPNKSLEWKNKKLESIINMAWKEAKKQVDPSRYKEYIKGIRYEVNAIEETKMADYFLLDYEIVKKGLENGGIITKTGRGSAVSYYINSLLGFSNIDRFISPVKLYPDRFLSKTRILQTKSLPDIDLNMGNIKEFSDAQCEIMGENHSYPMIAFGTLKVSSAFKLYAKSQNIPFTETNEVTKQIAKYEKDLKHAENEEEKASLNIYNYIDEKYWKYLDDSKKYLGIINSKCQAPSAWLIYDGDIRREIGLIKCKSASTNKEVITTVIDGMVAEHYKFVKNDLLKVEVWNTIYAIFNKINMKPLSIPEITKLIDNDKKTWDIYANGYTMGVNQCESLFGKTCCKRYKPQNIQELCALVAGLRPGFKTQLDNFLDRKPYTTGVKELDDLLVDSYHYIMYQENIMTYLGWLGIDQTETYGIIKKIAKKKFKEKELKELKERLLQGWIKNTGKEDGFQKTWDIIAASAKYSFNASHSFSYAYDSVYCAYLKAYYPYEFYSVMMDSLSKKGKKDKIIEYQNEMKEAFNINIGKYKWGKDNRVFSIDKENNEINPSLLSIKDVSQNLADELWEAYNKNKNIDNLYDLFVIIKNLKSSKSDAINSLIQVNYFEDYSNFIKVHELYEIFKQWYGKSTIKKDKLIDVPFDEILIKQYSKETDKQYSKCDMENILKSYFDEYLKNDDDRIIVCEVIQSNPNYNPSAVLFNTKNNKYYHVRLYKTDYAKEPLKLYDIIKLTNKQSKPSSHRVDGKWIKDYDNMETWINYSKIGRCYEVKKKGK